MKKWKNLQKKTYLKKMEKKNAAKCAVFTIDYKTKKGGRVVFFSKIENFLLKMSNFFLKLAPP